MWTGDADKITGYYTQHMGPHSLKEEEMVENINGRQNQQLLYIAYGARMKVEGAGGARYRRVMLWM